MRVITGVIADQSCRSTWGYWQDRDTLARLEGQLRGTGAHWQDVVDRPDWPPEPVAQVLGTAGGAKFPRGRKDEMRQKATTKRSPMAVEPRVDLGGRMVDERRLLEFKRLRYDLRRYKVMMTLPRALPSWK